MPRSTARLLVAWTLAGTLSGCAGGGGGGGGTGSTRGGTADRTAAKGGRGADRVDEGAREAEKRQALAARSGPDREIPAGALSEEELAEFRRGWRFFLDRDPRWIRARTDWLARGGAAPYVLAENLFRYFWSASTLSKKDEVLRVGREAAYVGEPAVGYFADLLVLSKWPLREAKTTQVFDPETGKPKSTTITHLEIDDVSRQNAALVLAAIGSPAVPALTSKAVTEAPSASSRTYGAYALGKIGDDAAVAALAGMLAGGGDWKQRAAAAKALGFALPKNPAARAPLEAALKDSDAFVRKKAQDALDGKGTLEF